MNEGLLCEYMTGYFLHNKDLYTFFRTTDKS